MSVRSIRLAEDEYPLMLEALAYVWGDPQLNIWTKAVDPTKITASEWIAAIISMSAREQAEKMRREIMKALIVLVLPPEDDDEPHHGLDFESVFGKTVM